MRLFVEVVDAGSMSEAAKRRGITRSSVSQRLRQLEHEMQAQLLRRTTRKLRPTEIGQTLYEHGRQIAYQFEAARHDVESLGKTLSGVIRVSVPTGIGHSHVAPALIKFADQHENLSLNLTFNNRLVDMIDADIDVALRIMKYLPADDLIAREICDVHWQFYCTPQYLEKFGPLETSADLQRCAFLTSFGRRRVDLSLIHKGGTDAVSLTPRFVSESIMFLRECMLQHMGVAMLSPYTARDLELGGQIVRVLPDHYCPDYDSKMFIITMPNRFPTPAMNAVISLLRETVLEAVGDASGETDCP
jgi:DNA-binding transcriptional LysR family regulator